MNGHVRFHVRIDHNDMLPQAPISLSFQVVTDENRTVCFQIRNHHWFSTITGGDASNFYFFVPSMRLDRVLIDDLLVAKFSIRANLIPYGALIRVENGLYEGLEGVVKSSSIHHYGVEIFDETHQLCELKHNQISIIRPVIGNEVIVIRGAHEGAHAVILSENGLLALWNEETSSYQSYPNARANLDNCVVYCM
jgi:hypothetical protein